jgi:hypothetical protein
MAAAAVRTAPKRIHSSYRYPDELLTGIIAKEKPEIVYHHAV